MAITPVNLRNPRVRALPQGFIRSYEEPEYGVTPAIYSGATQLLNWGLSPRRGMTVDFHLRDTGAVSVHPFKGMGCGLQNGQRLHVVASMPHPSDADEPGATIYAGEAVLLRWADDNISGMMIRILLDSGPDGASGRHPFDGLAAGRKDGEPLVLVAWAIADDERPVDPARVKRRQPFHTLNAVKQTHILCGDPRFVDWLTRRLHVLVPDEAARAALPVPEEHPKAFAERVVRLWCDVESRSVMNSDTVAGERARAQWRSLLSAYDDDSWGRR